MRYADLARVVLDRPARLGRSRLIAVDGPSGAGKSFFADRLTAALVGIGAEAVLVRTDDLLDGWSDQFTFWERLERWVLQPLRRGECGGFAPYDWIVSRRSTQWISVAPVPVVIVEGVSSSRAQIRPELSLAVLLTAPRPLRVARAAARDGSHLSPFMEHWRTQEEDFFIRDQTRAHADLVVDGAPAQATDDRDDAFVVIDHTGDLSAGL